MTNLTSTQLKELVQAHEVHWNLQVLIQKAQEITNLATSIQKSLQTFETGQEINQDKLLKDLERLRIIKHHLRGIRFIYFYQENTRQQDFWKIANDSSNNKTDSEN